MAVAENVGAKIGSSSQSLENGLVSADSGEVEKSKTKGDQNLHVDNGSLQLLLRMLTLLIMVLMRFVRSLRCQLLMMEVQIRRVFQAGPKIHQCC